MFNLKSFLCNSRKNEEFYQIIIFRGGLLAAVVVALVTKSSQILSHCHVSSTAPLTCLKTSIKRPEPHLITNSFNQKHLKLPNLQRWNGPAGPRI